MKPVRLILSAILGLSAFYCSSALSQMKPGPETAMASDTFADSAMNTQTGELLSGSSELFQLADLSGSVVSSSIDAGQAELAAEEVSIKSLSGRPPFEMLEEHKYLELPEYGELTYQIQSEKISRYSRAEKLLIARVVYAESRGEIFEGQVAVATVVLNRYESGLFGSSIAKIVFAPDQFAITEDYNSESLKAVERAISKLGAYPKNMYFFQASKSRIWRNFVYYKRIGNHSFYLSAN